MKNKTIYDKENMKYWSKEYQDKARRDLIAKSIEVNTKGVILVMKQINDTSKGKPKNKR